MKTGVHVTPSTSVTIEGAGENWIKAAEAHGLERATIKQYREHVEQHIVPFIGAMKLSEISAQTVRKFEGKLREKGRSPAMLRKVIGSLGLLLSDAQELAARNAVRDLRRNRRRGRDQDAERRQKGKLKIGVDIPTPDEIKAIITTVEGRWRPRAAICHVICHQDGP